MRFSMVRPKKIKIGIIILIIMKDLARVKHLSFINHSSLIQNILFEDFVSISSLTSEDSSMLNFSTFRSEDFAELSREDSPPPKFLTLHKNSTRDSESERIKFLNFRNEKSTIKRILLTDKIGVQGKEQKIKKPIQMSFRVDKNRVQQILSQ